MLCGAFPVQLLSDELLILRKLDGVWHAIVSPFVGSRGLPHGREVPLKSINFLVQAPHNRRHPLGTAPAVQEFCKHILTYACTTSTTQQVLDLAADIVQSVPAYQLEFKKDPSIGSLLGLALAA
jgi:hypothetical protein